MDFRTALKKTLDGKATFQGLGAFDAKLKLDLPTLVTAGFAAQATDKFLFSFQYGFERNSEIKNLELTLSGVGSLTIPQNYRDSHTFHFGGKYDFCDSFSLLAGYAKDFRESIPDTAMNRITGDVAADELSFGAQGNYKKMTVGLSWNGRFGDRTIQNTGFNPAPGYYKAFIHTLSAGVGFKL